MAIATAGKLGPTTTFSLAVQLYEKLHRVHDAQKAVGQPGIANSLRTQSIVPESPHDSISWSDRQHREPPLAQSEGTDQSGILSFPQLFADSRFTIPGNQRSYVWKNKHVLQFLDDVDNSNTMTRFFGAAIVSGASPHTIIDGQQRMTTVSLIALALTSHLNVVDPLSLETLDPQAEMILSTCNRILYTPNGIPRIQYPTAHFMPQLLGSESEDRQRIVNEAAAMSPSSAAGNIARDFNASRSI